MWRIRRQLYREDRMDCHLWRIICGNPSYAPDTSAKASSPALHLNLPILLFCLLFCVTCLMMHLNPYTSSVSCLIIFTITSLIIFSLVQHYFSHDIFLFFWYFGAGCGAGCGATANAIPLLVLLNNFSNEVHINMFMSLRYRLRKIYVFVI